MYNVKIETYRLDLIDLEILLAYMEVDYMWGFSTHKKIDKAEVIQGIHRLAQKQIIDITEGKINIKPIYMQFLENIKNVERCIVVKSSGIKHKKKCCYVGKEVLVSEVSGVRKGEVILYVVEREDFFELLKEEAYFYEEDSPQISEPEDWESVEYEDFANNSVDEEVLLKMEVFEKQNNTLTILVTEEDEKKWIVVQSDNRRTKSGYQLEKVKQMMEKILDGERI